MEYKILFILRNKHKYIQERNILFFGSSEIVLM